jgi:DNA-binding NtrC family response regulator
MARILLIEPDRSLRNFIAGILADLGHEVAACRNVGESRDRLSRGAFDVLATDLVLGDRADQVVAAAADVKILTLSGRHFRPEVDLSEGAARLHEKPFRFDDLQTLAAAISQQQPEELLAA